jgi:hypothetical protein
MKKWFNRTFAPYRIYLMPTDGHDTQVVYAWSWEESVAWMGCALRSDWVTIETRRNRQLALRLPTVEVTHG